MSSRSETSEKSRSEGDRCGHCSSYKACFRRYAVSSKVQAVARGGEPRRRARPREVHEIEHEIATASHADRAIRRFR